MRVLVLFLCVVNGLWGAEGLPAARTVTIKEQKLPLSAAVKQIKEQTGMVVDVSALDDRETTVNWNRVPFWTAVLSLAGQCEAHLETPGGRVTLKPGKATTPSFVRGPFLFVAREIATRLDLQRGPPTYELTIDVIWEPLALVYRIDTLPANAQGRSDQGTKLTFPTSAPRTLPTTNTVSLTVRPQGLTRAAKSFSLSGALMATVADELLTFSYDATGKTLGPATQKGVTVHVTKSAKDGNDWLVRLDLQYPKDGPLWESFESAAWKERNILRFLPPTGPPILPEAPIDEGSVQYVFKNQAKTIGNNWKLDYRTPGPMREVAIPFELNDIPLP